MDNVFAVDASSFFTLDVAHSRFWQQKCDMYNLLSENLRINHPAKLDTQLEERRVFGLI
jgi:hypothetical protein